MDNREGNVPLKPPTAYLDAAKAQDLEDLLDHIAWTDVIRPALYKTRDDLTQQLVSSTLGVPVQIQTITGPVDVSREQLAGKIFGINYIISMFEKLLQRGEIAAKQLKELGINL